MPKAVATPSVGTQVNSVENTQKSIIVRGTIAVQATPLLYAAGGLVCDLSPLAAVVPVGAAPLYLMAWSQRAYNAGPTTTFIYSFLPGTTLLNGMLQAFVTGAGDGQLIKELADGAVPAALSGDTIFFEAVFAR